MPVIKEEWVDFCIQTGRFVEPSAEHLHPPIVGTKEIEPLAKKRVQYTYLEILTIHREI